MSLGLVEEQEYGQVVVAVSRREGIEAASVIVLFPVAVPAPRGVRVTVATGTTTVEDTLFPASASAFSVPAATGTDGGSVSGNPEMLDIAKEAQLGGWQHETFFENLLQEVMRTSLESRRVL
jgi:hypothetical protein